MEDKSNCKPTSPNPQEVIQWLNNVIDLYDKDEVGVTLGDLIKKELVEKELRYKNANSKLSSTTELSSTPEFSSTTELPLELSSTTNMASTTELSSTTELEYTPSSELPPRIEYTQKSLFHDELTNTFPTTPDLHYMADFEVGFDKNLNDNASNENPHTSKNNLEPIVEFVDKDHHTYATDKGVKVVKKKSATEKTPATEKNRLSEKPTSNHNKRKRSISPSSPSSSAPISSSNSSPSISHYQHIIKKLDREIGDLRFDNRMLRNDFNKRCKEVNYLRNELLTIRATNDSLCDMVANEKKKYKDLQFSVECGRYKTEKCYHYEKNGRCYNGAQCRFAHIN